MANVSEQVLMACPVVDVIDLLTSDPTEWIEPFFKIAAMEGLRAGDELRVEMGLPRSTDHDRLTLLSFQEAEQGPGGTVVLPFLWRAVGMPALFTSFLGRFVVWAAGTDETMFLVEGVTDGTAEADEVTSKATATALRSLVRNLRTAIEASYGVPESRRA